MDNIIEVKQGVQGMNLDPVTALLFEQCWLKRERTRLERCGLLCLKEHERAESRLTEVNRQIEDLGNKTFKLC